MPPLPLLPYLSRFVSLPVCASSTRRRLFLSRPTSFLSAERRRTFNCFLFDRDRSEINPISNRKRPIHWVFWLRRITIRSISGEFYLGLQTSVFIAKLVIIIDAGCISNILDHFINNVNEDYFILRNLNICRYIIHYYAYCYVIRSSSIRQVSWVFFRKFLSFEAKISNKKGYSL